MGLALWIRSCRTTPQIVIDSFLSERTKDVEKVLTLAESPPLLNLFLVSLLIGYLIMESVAYFYG